VNLPTRLTVSADVKLTHRGVRIQSALTVNTNADRGLSNLLGYKYFVCLRHYGFPSPLLDWSRSPYFAALFAFSGATQNSRRMEGPDIDV
jgi:hypothetical protein